MRLSPGRLGCRGRRNFGHRGRLPVFLSLVGLRPAALRGPVSRATIKAAAVVRSRRTEYELVLQNMYMVAHNN
jgi:hypothetical protein